MKVLCLALLLVLASQLKLTVHRQKVNLLAGNSYEVTSNQLGLEEIDGTIIKFSDDNVEFLKCNLNNGGYHVDVQAIEIQPYRKWNTGKRKCEDDVDDFIIQLLSSSSTFDIDSEGGVTLLNQKGQQLLKLVQEQTE